MKTKNGKKKSFDKWVKAQVKRQYALKDPGSTVDFNKKPKKKSWQKSWF